MKDVVIIGSGAAGMMAALAAAELGRSVLVLERGAHIAVSNGARAGGPALANTLAQREENATVSAQRLFDHMYAFSRGTVNAALLRNAIDQGAEVDRVFRACGVETKLLPDAYGVGFRARQGFVDGGKKRWQPLADAVKRLDGEILFNRKVTKIQPLPSGGWLISALDESQDIMHEYRGKTVIIATGGYLGSQSMLQEHFGNIHVLPLGNKLSDGTGIQLAKALGGMEDRSWGICANEFCGANSKICGAQFAEETRYAVCGGLLVNRQGRRFMNEQLMSDHPLSSGGEATLREGKYYAVVDDAMLSALHTQRPYEYMGSPNAWYAGRMNADPLRGRSKGIEKAVEEGWAWHGSAEEIAGDAHLPALTETVSAYNRMCAECADTVFGKSAYLLKALDPEHLNVFEYEPSAWCTFGGVKTDAFCRLLNEEQQIIPGIYVAGVDNGSCYCTPYYDNEGAALGLALTTGIVAGKHAAQFVSTEGK